MRLADFLPLTIAASFLVVLAPAAPAAATPRGLPFVGSRLVNFEGGTGTGYWVAIDRNGETQVLHLGVCEVSVRYSGPFQSRLPLGGNKTMSLTAAEAQLYRNGKLAKACEGSCSSPVTKPQKGRPMPRPGRTDLCD